MIHPTIPGLAIERQSSTRSWVTLEGIVIGMVDRLGPHAFRTHLIPGCNDLGVQHTKRNAAVAAHQRHLERSK